MPTTVQETRMRSAQRPLILVVTLAGSLAMGYQADAQLYSLTDLGDLPGGLDRSIAHAINNAGEIVGRSESGAGERAFHWTAAQGMVSLGTLGDTSWACAISDSGFAAGLSQTPSGTRAFRWDASRGMTDLGVPPGFDHAEAWGVNASGTVAGFCRQFTTTRAFVWDAATGQMEDLGDMVGGAGIAEARAINDNGFVVGWASAATGERAFLWDPATRTMSDLGDLSGGADASRAVALNNRNVVVGSSLVGQGLADSHAFLWDPATRLMRDLGDLPGGDDMSAALDVNSLDDVVGFSDAGVGGFTSAFLWTPTGGMTDLNYRLDASGTGWFLTHANNINDRGEIVAAGITPDGAYHGVLLRPVPAPGPVALLGVAGILGSRRRR